MIYDYYYDGKIIEGSNIQSLAALQFLPLNCKPYFVDRDLIQFYHGPKVKLIINGWNLIHEGNKYTSNEISPIYISYHIRNGDPLPSIFLEKLKKFAPIGCRDLKTKKQLNKYGIDTYFSSCITTILDIDIVLMKLRERMKLFLLIMNLEIFQMQMNFFILLRLIILKIL